METWLIVVLVIAGIIGLVVLYFIALFYYLLYAVPTNYAEYLAEQLVAKSP